ncbi:MAG: phage tail protein, partial [Longimicrobiales bacterium]
MPGTLIKLTAAGRAALVGPGNTGTQSRQVVSVGIANAPFAHSDGLTALPNEYKRVATIAGKNVAPDTIHVTIRDDSADQYTAFGFGLYLDNGALLG